MIDENLLTLSLSVSELPSFHLQFSNAVDLEQWKQALLDINNPRGSGRTGEYEQETSGTDDEDERMAKGYRFSSQTSAYGAAKSYGTAPTEYSRSVMDMRPAQNLHVPLDIVLVIPVSSSMQGLKISLLRDALKFLVTSLGEKDRMGLVTFGSSGGGVPVVSMTSKSWEGWSRVLESIRPVGQKSLRADVVEGANVAMDLLMQRKSANPISSILLISDSSTSDAESVDFVVQRAEAAKYVSCHAISSNTNISKGHDSFFWPRSYSQTRHDDRTLDQDESVVYICQRLDDASRMRCWLPRIFADHFTPERQAETTSSRRLSRKVR
jgi:hypothetical protein